MLADTYPAAYQTLYQAKPITCSVTGTTFDAVPVPCAVILDVSLLMCYGRQWYEQFMIAFQLFTIIQLRATRAISGHSIPIIACIAFGAAAIIRLFGPESIGGMGDMGARIDAEAARTGLTVDEIGDKAHMSILSSL